MAGNTRTIPAFASSAGTKRPRENHDEGADGSLGSPFGKRARPTPVNATPTNPAPWQLHDSVLSTPTNPGQPQEQPFVGGQTKYDSDDQSSMVSEPGSPQYIGDASSDDGDGMDMDMDNAAAFSQSPEDHLALSSGAQASSSPWREQQRSSRTRNRIATPFTSHTQTQYTSRSSGGGSRGGFMQQLQTVNTRSPSQHVRQRHPQENLSGSSSDVRGQGQAQAHLEVPSPIDEDEVPTPPSAAEAAGSQLSMLSVNDMDIETEELPAITVHPSRSSLQLDGPHAMDGLDGNDGGLLVRKQRLRSGAQSHGSVSPVAGGRFGIGTEGGGLVKKGLSMGFRADCEKCRLRVPGHMNHFVM
ncbi:hypothetical protein LTR08_005475 [Meristemomyces frigidus]|nr:hypothetical protein LTR08_005475 [Meristemomyces frigidus]